MTLLDDMLLEIAYQNLGYPPNGLSTEQIAYLLDEKELLRLNVPKQKWSRWRRYHGILTKLSKEYKNIFKDSTHLSTQAQLEDCRKAIDSALRPIPYVKEYLPGIPRVKTRGSGHLNRYPGQDPYSDIPGWWENVVKRIENTP